QEDHDPADGLLLLPALADALNPPRADTLDVAEKSRTLVDDGEGALAEHLDDLAGEVRPDSLDEAGAEVLDDPFDGVRRRGAQLLGFELRSVVAVLYPGAAGFHILAGNHAWQLADHRHGHTPALGLHAQHGEAGLWVVERDALDDAADSFGHSCYSTRF